ncbi:hypothetical protein [Polaromonas sp.]|uniref:recombination directionality factor n=1 Tax=Polaromonas sp. TaxID=1869339 RepID=UPI00345117A4
MSGDFLKLGSFIFRTTGYNSIRTLSTRLKYFHAVSGGLLSTLPLELRLRGKSTTQSHRAPIYYVDLTVQSGMTLAEAIAGARAEDGHRKGAGFDQVALEDAARQGFANGAFEESEEEGADLVDEFYPAGEGDPAAAKSAATVKTMRLQDKLGQKAAEMA